MINIVLQLTFITCQYDLSFVSKFRRINKFCKACSEEWLYEISIPMFLKHLKVSQFRNLRKLICSNEITDESLYHLTSLTYLNILSGSLITDQSLRYLTKLTS